MLRSLVGSEMCIRDSIYTKYLNPDACSSCSPSNITSHRGLLSLTTITLLLATLTFKHLLLHTLPNLSTNPLKLSQIRHTKPNHPHIIGLSLIHISEPTRLLSISYAVFCLKKKNTNKVSES